MINFETFKKMYDSIPGEPEFELYFNDRKDTYWIIKYSDYVTYQKSGFNSNEIKYDNLDELYNVNLKDSWQNITDIVIDTTFSIKDDKEDIEDTYNVKL